VQQLSFIGGSDGSVFMSTGIIPRAYQGVDDLRRMQILAQALWSSGGRFHIGDLAWQRAEGKEENWPTALWEKSQEILGWGWIHLPGHLYLAAQRQRVDIASDILDWFEKTASDDVLSIDVLDSEAHVVAALEARNYRRRATGPFDLYVRLDLSRLPAKPILPMGLRPMSMRSCHDIGRRAESHRVAWHPSGMNEVRYRRVMNSWPYRRELDWVIEVADGRFVANCCIWFDETNKVGLLEPLGVDPGFRRQGLAKAVGMHALHALKDLGATSAITYPRGDEAYPFTKPLYLGMGFAPYARTLSFERSRKAH
jgi:GNAT superfamily N-acetyltransferase